MEMKNLFLTHKFLSAIHKCNTKAKKYGYVCCKQWLKIAREKGEISDLEYAAFDTTITLRNHISHGKAGEIEVSEEMLILADKLLDVVNKEVIKSN